MAYRDQLLPVSAGGTLRATLTDHGVLVGAGTSAVTQLAVGATGTVFTGVTGADPAFSATPSVTSITLSSGTALSTYIVGTFTPGLTFGGSATGIVYSAQLGFYTRIGDVVNFSIYIAITNNGTGTGNAVVTGLPITTGGNANLFFATSSFFSGLTFTASYVGVGLQFNNSTTTANLMITGSGQTRANLTDAMVANISEIGITGFYKIV